MRIQKSDFIWSYVGTILNVSINLVIWPFVLAFLSDDELGLWYVFSSLSALLALLDFGFAPTLARNVAYSWSGANVMQKEGIDSIDVSDTVETKVFNTVLKASRIIYRVVAAAAFLLGASIGTYYIYTIASTSDMPDWFISWVFYGTAIVLNLYYGYLSVYLRGIGAIAENSKAVLCSKIVQLIGTLALLFCGLGLLGASIAYFASCLVLRLLSLHYFWHYDGMKEEVKKMDQAPSGIEVKETFVLIWHNAWRDGLVSLSLFLNTQATTLICSAVLGLASTGSYGIAVQIATIIASIGSIWYGTVQPSLQECAVTRNSQSAVEKFSTSIVIYVLICLPLILLATFLGIPILNLLRGSVGLDPLMIFVVCFYMFLYRMNNLFTSCISNYNRIPYMTAYVITGIASISISYLLAKFTALGLWSLIIPSILCFCAYNIWKWPSEALKLLEVSPKRFIATGISQTKSVLLKALDAIPGKRK